MALYTTINKFQGMLLLNQAGTPPPFTQVQSDYAQTNTAAVDFIKNKPAPFVQQPSDWNAVSPSVTRILNKPTIPPAQVNADWSATGGVQEVLNKPTLDFIPNSARGVSVATLVGGVVPANQLPSFVDDVLEFPNVAAFPPVGEGGKIYVAINNNKTYRWSGSIYVEISQSVIVPTVISAFINDVGYITVADVTWANISNKPTFGLVATTNNYNDLSNLPTIPAAQVQANYTETNSLLPSFIQNKPSIPAAQVNSDWAATGGITEIYNKPILAIVATTGAYNDLTGKPDLSLKADLVGGKVPATQLPAYVDDVLEFANLAGFPVTGELGKIYVTLDTNKTYRWSGSVYIELNESLAQVQTDWNATSGLGVLLNKPTSLPPNGTAGGELAGTYPNPTLSNSAVIGKVLTGYTSGAGVIAPTDTILQAIQKLNGNMVTITASDGLTKVGNDIRLGGTIPAAGTNLTFGASGSQFTFTKFGTSFPNIFIGGSDVYIGDSFNGNLVNLTLAGFLSVTGATTLTGTSTLTMGTGTFTTGGTIQANGALNVIGITTVRNFTVSAGFAVNINSPVTIPNASTFTMGTGAVNLGTGALTIGGATTVNANMTFGATRTLTVGTGATTLGGTLGVTGVATFSGGILAGSQRIQNVGTPTAATDAVTKAYVDATQFVAAPANATSTGVVNQMAVDANFVYFCTATNTWVRVARDISFV